MTSYLGHTPWKKFKKIILISKELIDVYGLRYFFYVINLELKKQGLSIFLPDAKPIPLYDEKQFHNKYQTFLKNMTRQLKHESISELSYNPNICIILQATKNIHDLELSISSIKEQTYKNWFVKILVSERIDNPKLQNLKSSQISLIDTSKDDSYKKLFSEDSDFIGFFTTGAILSSYAFFKFVKTLEKFENCDILYCDHDQINDSGTREKPFFKPDWSPYMLRSMDFLSPFYLIRKSLAEKSTIQPKLKKCINFDILLQCSEKTNNIIHIPIPLVSLVNIQYIPFNCKKIALDNHLKRINVNAKINEGIIKDTFRINYSIKEKPKVSIIIPTKNNPNILKRCIDSIGKKTHYENWEIIIINNSDESISKKKSIQLVEYLKSIPYTVLTYHDNFNFSKMNNIAVNSAMGDLLLFLNDDTKVIDPYWLDELVSIILQKDVGAVGPKLIYSDNTIQHAGMVFLNTASGFHPSMKEPENSSGYYNQINIMREYSAVTGACLLTKKDIFEKVGGFDNMFDAYYGDSDLCLKIRDAGYRIIYTPFTKLLHEGSFSLSHTDASYFAVESHQDFLTKWPSLKSGDPFYNPNLGWNYDIEICE